MDYETGEVKINLPATPKRWKYSTRGVAIRLFVSCWIIYGLHFTTNIVREIYPAVALGDHLSFRVDEYADMHPDLFEKDGYGWHIGNNPGVSMIAAVPYAMVRPIIDRVVDYVNQTRTASGQTDPPPYNSPWPMARDFYAEAWRRGVDVKLGLAAIVMQTMAMAPSSALGVVIMFYLLREIFTSDKTAFFLSLLYAFGTPVFFRTGFLNHNLMLGHFAFMGFVTMWNLKGNKQWSKQRRFFLGGLAGGAALLFDYSGVVLLLGLFVYGFIKQWRDESFQKAVYVSVWYVLGTLGPIALLWLYQWRSFGNPFLPGQHWMPPVEWIELGYQGYGFPRLDLFLMLGFDYRFGFFVSSPLLLLALAAPFVDRGEDCKLPKFELAFLLAIFIAFWVFFSGSNYTRLQFNTGIRYMSPMFPFVFIPAAIVLVRLPQIAMQMISVISFVEAWAMAMYRDVESGFGVLNPIIRLFAGGFQLPVLSTLLQLRDQFGRFIPNGVSPIPLFILTGVIIYIIWSPFSLRTS
jgi:hypothetical protein